MRWLSFLICSVALFPFWYCTEEQQYRYGEDTADTILHFKLEETGSPLVDTITGTEVPATGSPAYGVSIANDNYFVDPGVRTSTGNYFYKDLTIIEQNNYFIPAGTNFTLQMWFAGTRIFDQTGYIGVFGGPDSFSDDAILVGALNSKVMRLVLIPYTEAQTDVLDVDASSLNLDDGNPHHYRAVFRRSGTSEIWIDGVLRATKDLTGITSFFVPKRVSVGAAVSATPSAFKGSIFEIKLDKNDTANSYPQ